MTLTTDPLPAAHEDDALAAALRDPQVRASLAVIAANAPNIALLVSSAQALLTRAPDITANVNGIVGRLRDAADGTDGGSGQIDSLRGAVNSLNQLAPIAPPLAARTEVITQFLDSPILQPQIVEVISRLGEAAMEADRKTRGKPHSVGGALALLRQLRDPQVQQTLAFAVEFAKCFGAAQATDADTQRQA